MKIGIFGGSFNPPHNMHYIIAISLIKNGYVDKVIYVPTGDKYDKKDLILASKRYDMLKLMISNDTNLAVSDYEINNKLTYTYETLDYFKNKYKDDDIYFICGSDNLKQIDTWKNYKYILDNYKLLVIRRDNDDISELENRYHIDNVVLEDISISDISSTIIRDNIKNGNIDKMEKKINKKVLEYIKKYKLYMDDM